MGLLKAKLAKYRSQLLEPSKKGGDKGEGFDVLKSGDARVALIGFPSVGKVRSCLYYHFKLCGTVISAFTQEVKGNSRHTHLTLWS